MRKLVIDQDAGSDDAMALFMAFLYEKHFGGPQIVAVTISHGNVNESQAFRNTQRILDIAKRRDVPIYRGSSKSIVFEPTPDHFFGMDGLGDTKFKDDFALIDAEPELAPLGLIELSKQYEGDLEILTLGAVTNIALAVRLDPTFIQRVKQIYIAGGHVQSDNFTTAEYNILADVEAYKIIMEVAQPDLVTLIPFSQVQQTLGLSWKFRKDVLGELDTDIMRAQNEFDKQAFKKTNVNQFQYLDPAAMAVVLNHGLVNETSYSKSDVLLCGETRGHTTTDLVEKTDANVKIFMSFCRNSYRQFLFDIFSLDL